jgi:hypothetical protein
MMLIVYYIGLTLIADFAAVMLCLGIEEFWPTASLLIFIGLYFAILWVAWLVAVRLTEPKAVPAPAHRQPAE